MPRTVALRHVAFEDLGLLAPILERRGHSVRYVEVPVAGLDDLDPVAPELLIVLGGPIGVYETDDYPFLSAEIAWLERRLAAGLPTLGLCLGSQLIARALGSRVYPAGVKEIGWGPIELTREGRASCLRHLANTAVLHWHGDTFDLPEGAVRLASTALCKNQAFSWGGNVLALQFHAEVAGRALEAWFVGHTAEIGATPGLSVARLRADTAAWTPAITVAGAACFEDWLGAVRL
jgi:GMP synthase (glutamine-hydrolysing)